MPSTYDLKYIPPKKGDEWKPETLAGALEKAQKLNSLDPSSGKGLEALVGEFLGSEFGNFEPKLMDAALKGYKGMVSNSIGDYLIGNLKGAVSYVGDQNVLPLAMNLPYSKRKATESAQLSETDKKYNAIVSAGDNLKQIIEATKTKEGRKKELDAELDGASDFSKKFWTDLLGEEVLLNYRAQKVQRKLANAITAYGVSTYMKDAIAISEKAEKELAEKTEAIEKRMNSELEEKAKTGSITPMEAGKIRDKYSPEFAEVQKKYEGQTNAKQIILNGGEEVPGLLRLFSAKYQEEEAKKKAEAEKKKKEEAKEKEK